VFSRIATGDDLSSPGQPAAIAVVNVDDLSASPTLPLRVQAGVAWKAGKLLLTADATYLGAREVRDDANRASEGLERHVRRNAVLNGAAGLEYWASDAVPLRFGLFTDLAASEPPAASPPGGGTVNADNTTHVNRYGATFASGLRTAHTATDVGVNVSYGSGTDLVPNNLDFSDLKPSTSKQFLLYVFLSSAYEF